MSTEAGTGTARRGPGRGAALLLAALYLGLGGWFAATGSPWPAAGFVVVGALWLLTRRYPGAVAASRRDPVAAAGAAMTSEERAAAIAALHTRERALLLAGDLDAARRTAMDKSILLSIHTRTDSDTR